MTYAVVSAAAAIALLSMRRLRTGVVGALVRGASSVHASPLRRASRPAHRLPRAARPAVHGRRSSGRRLDDRRRRRPRAVRDAGAGARLAPRENDALLRRTKRRGALLSRLLSRARR